MFSRKSLQQTGLSILALAALVVIWVQKAQGALLPLNQFQGGFSTERVKQSVWQLSVGGKTLSIFFISSDGVFVTSLESLKDMLGRPPSLRRYKIATGLRPRKKPIQLELPVGSKLVNRELGVEERISSLELYFAPKQNVSWALTADPLFVKDFIVVKAPFSPPGHLELASQPVQIGERVFAIGYTGRSTEGSEDQKLQLEEAIVLRKYSTKISPLSDSTDSFLTDIGPLGEMPGVPTLNSKGEVTGMVRGSFRLEKNIPSSTTFDRFRTAHLDLGSFSGEMAKARLCEAIVARKEKASDTEAKEPGKPNP